MVAWQHKPGRRESSGCTQGSPGACRFIAYILVAIGWSSSGALAQSGIEFFETSIDRDAYVWCVDRSASMGSQGQLETVKRELRDALAQLEPDDRFALIAFSDNWTAWSPTLVLASPAEVASAMDWVDLLVAEGSSCMAQAVVSALQIARTADSSSVLLVSDGADSCGGVPVSSGATLVDITSANFDQVPIDSYYVPGDSAAATLLANIAASNLGQFVNTAQILSLFRRGDANQDGVTDLSDALFILLAGFVSSSPQPDCLDAADADDSGEFEPLVDALAILQSLFDPGAAPLPQPTGTCGPDTDFDLLVCSGSCP